MARIKVAVLAAFCTTSVLARPMEITQLLSGVLGSLSNLGSFTLDEGVTTTINPGSTGTSTPTQTSANTALITPGLIQTLLPKIGAPQITPSSSTKTRISNNGSDNNGNKLKAVGGNDDDDDDNDDDDDGDLNGLLSNLGINMPNIANVVSQWEAIAGSAIVTVTAGGDIITISVPSFPSDIFPTWGPTTTSPAPTPPSVSTVPTASPTPPSGGGDPTSNSDYQEKVVYSHNIHRANHSASDLIWDDDLASTAQTIGQTCTFAHSMNVNGGGYGQNIAAGVQSVEQVITNMFYDDEIEWFGDQYGLAQPDMQNFEKWGHFSQLVWASSVKVGCATVYCPNGWTNLPSDYPPWFTVCNYSPPGNYDNEYGANVRPPLGRPTIRVP